MGSVKFRRIRRCFATPNLPADSVKILWESRPPHPSPPLTFFNEATLHDVFWPLEEFPANDRRPSFTYDLVLHSFDPLPAKPSPAMSVTLRPASIRQGQRPLAFGGEESTHLPCASPLRATRCPARFSACGPGATHARPGSQASSSIGSSRLCCPIFNPAATSK